MAADRRLGGHHIQRGRNALVGHVCDHHAEMVVVHHEEIVKVAADLLCGGHGSVDIEFLPVRESRENTGQRTGLYAGRHIQFAADPLLFFSAFFFLRFLLQRSGLLPEHLPHDPCDQQEHRQRHGDPECGLFIESLQLHDGDGSAAGFFRSALQIQAERVRAAPEVRIADLVQILFGTEDGRAVETLEIIGNFRVVQPVGEHVGIDAQTAGARRHGDGLSVGQTAGLFVRIDLHKGDREDGRHARRLDVVEVQPDQAVAAGHVSVAVFHDAASGIRRDHVRQAFFGIIVLVFPDRPGDQIVAVHHEDTGVAHQEDFAGISPQHVVAAVGIQFRRVIGQQLRDPVFQDAQRAAGDEPEAMPPVVPLDAHDHAVVQFVLNRIRNRPVPLDHVDPSPVGA